MREIKFRAWDKMKKKMVKVNSVYFPNRNNKNMYVNNIQCNTPESFELIEYTGLKDKNGVEIYEGDIVCWRDEDAIYSVNFGEFGVPNVETESYQDLAVGFFIKPEHDWKEVIPFSLTLPLNSIYVKEIKVIGNIYENKELLEVTE